MDAVNSVTKYSSTKYFQQNLNAVSTFLLHKNVSENGLGHTLYFHWTQSIGLGVLQRVCVCVEERTTYVDLYSLVHGPDLPGTHDVSRRCGSVSRIVSM